MATSAECYDCGCRGFMIPVCGHPMASCAYSNIHKKPIVGATKSSTKSSTTGKLVEFGASVLLNALFNKKK